MPAERCRLPSGGCIDRSERIGFTFNGRQYYGYRGDTLASALLANGVVLTARSFKYHRPRGIVGAGIEEPSTLVELLGDDQSANQPATTVPLRPGLVAKSVNCWPSAQFDVLSINQLFAGLLPAAFYYKTFMWPDWRWFEPYIRRAAGLAAAPARPSDQLRYETRHGHCELLIVGAGAAGLMAALTAARSGARVVLADAGIDPGGALNNGSARLDGRPAAEWVAAATAALAQASTVTHLQQATVWAYREHNLLLVTQHIHAPERVLHRTWRLRAGRVVLATGALERPLVFADNDRPGVMLASAVSTYIRRYAVKPGRRAVIFTNNDSAYATAGQLRRAGIELAAIVDSRAAVNPAVTDQLPDSRILRGHVVVKANGRKRLKGVRVKSLQDATETVLGCDLLCLSGGWDPAVHLFSQARGTLRYDRRIAAFVPDRPAQQVVCAGAAAGIFELDRVLADGAAKAQAALDALGCGGARAPVPACDQQPAYAIEPLWQVEQSDPGARCFVDLHNDVTTSDMDLAVREGFGAVEHAKRYTTAGMGPDQGKTGNINVIGVLANRTGQTLAAVGTTTFRAPYAPIEFGALAGWRQGPVSPPYRHTPLTQWHIDHGAVMYEAGARWRRPGYYPRAGERFQATVNREAAAVRALVALYDGSPLGKYAIVGPDALNLLELLYTNSFAGLGVHAGRYGLMLTDDGLLLDDGVTFKLAENHYLMFTSTGQADAVYRHMEQLLQIERPHWRVRITPVTSQWANLTVCGPQARRVMQALGPDIDLSPTAFPFMALRQGRVGGFPAWVCRVSFTGELSFEINVFSRYAAPLWEKILAAGAAFNLMPIGSEANHVLRVEKGFLSLGHEADGTVDPYDLGLGWLMSRTKHDFIGQRAVALRRAAVQPRRELVGLWLEDVQRLVPEGAPITPGGRREASEGLVTACVWSVVHRRTIALALLLDGRNRIGQKVFIRLPHERVGATVTRPCFHDPEGALLRS